MPDLDFAIPGFTVAEEAFARAEHEGKLPDAQRVHEISPEQRLQEMAVAVDLDPIAVLRLERGDLPGPRHP